MSETKLIHIKSRKSKGTIEIEARLLLENLIQDEGDDDVLDMAISIAYKENKNVKFVFKEKEIEPVIAYGIRYNSGFDIRHSH
jgi:hypothetical protein